MRMPTSKELLEFLIIILLIAIVAAAIWVNNGCASQGIKATGGEGSRFENEQSSNNPWPWMIALVISNSIWPIGIFAFLWFSKRFIGFGRT
jgi:hypothetical protein